uniref:LAM_G_DOMAIN domain-containing protein n=1 Tax=Caenorhabditis tropicalis TaxID=1561998 RepID=A0A1I7T0C7_9PELO
MFSIFWIMVLVAVLGLVGVSDQSWSPSSQPSTPPPLIPSSTRYQLNVPEVLKLPSIFGIQSKSSKMKVVMGPNKTVEGLKESKIKALFASNQISFFGFPLASSNGTFQLILVARLKAFVMFSDCSGLHVLGWTNRTVVKIDQVTSRCTTNKLDVIVFSNVDDEVSISVKKIKDIEFHILLVLFGIGVFVGVVFAADCLLKKNCNDRGLKSFLICCKCCKKKTTEDVEENGIEMRELGDRNSVRMSLLNEEEDLTEEAELVDMPEIQSMPENRRRPLRGPLMENLRTLILEHEENMAEEDCGAIILEAPQVDEDVDKMDEDNDEESLEEAEDQDFGDVNEGELHDENGNLIGPFFEDEDIEDVVEGMEVAEDQDIEEDEDVEMEDVSNEESFHLDEEDGEFQPFDENVDDDGNVEMEEVV